MELATPSKQPSGCQLVGGKSKRDKFISFDEPTHKYTVNGKIMSRSCTQLVHEQFSEFDGPKIATSMLNRNDFSTLDRYKEYYELVKYLDLDDNDDFAQAVEIIIKSWNDAADLGTTMHKAIETYYQTSEESDTREFELFKEFDKYARESGYIPYRSEQKVWDEEYCLAGSCDMMYIKKIDIDVRPRRIWLVDWKRCKNIAMEGFGRPEYRKHGKAPFDNKDDCNYEHYSLQLNIYKHLLQKHYQMEITRMTLVILHPKQKTYLKCEVYDNGRAVNKLMQSLITPSTDDESSETISQ